MKKPAPLIQLFFFLWLACFVLSFSLPFLMEAKGDGFTRGLNRVGALLGWQLGATVFALLGFITGIGKLKEHRGMAWLSRGPAVVQATLICALLALILYMRFASKPAAASEYPPPKATAAPAAASVPETVAGLEETAQTESYSGIYHRGFEASHFYSSDGQGPWWVESSSEADQALNPFFIDGPGRSGGITVALKVEGWLSDNVTDLTHLGSFQKRLHVVSIDSVRGLSQEEFEQVRTAFLGQK